MTTINKISSAVLCAIGSKRGAAMVEYALLAGLIAVVAITALSTLGTNVNAQFGAINSKL